jgi:predicted nucleic acid-binding protein
VRIFLDSNIVIYLIEQPAHWGEEASARVEAILEAGDRIVASDLVRMECRVRPLAAEDAQGLADFDDFFASEKVEVVPITAEICDRAAAIRAKHRFRPLDALHLAAAATQGCERFLTHDLRLERFPDLAIEALA